MALVRPFVHPNGTSSTNPRVGFFPEPWRRLIMNDRRAQELVAAERTRIETALTELTGAVRAEGRLRRQQEGESDAGSELATEMVDKALIANLQAELDAVARAEARIRARTYGRSTESGAAIPDERLEAEPLAELTVDEQRRFDEGGR